MNGENPNNQLNNQLNNQANGQNVLNGTVLNHQNQVGVPTGVNLNAASPEVLDVKTPEPVAVPIPGTEGTNGVNNLMGATAGSGVSLMNNDGINPNSFGSTNKMDNIGVVPPQINNDNKKKKMNKGVFIILILALIALVAFGVYYVLNTAANRIDLTTKNITIGVGDVASDNIKDYVTVKKGDLSSCRLNNKNVNSTEIGEYEYTVVCKDKTFTGKVIVADQTIPQVVVNAVFKKVNDQINVNDFIASCTDNTECVNTFVDEQKVNDYMKTVGGPYEVEINVSDKNNNSKVVKTDLYVTDIELQSFYVCSLASQDLQEHQAKKEVFDTFPFGHDEIGELKMPGIARRDYTYTFNTTEEYQEVILDKPDTITFDNVTGKAFYDDENLKLTISTNLSIDTLNSENNNSFPSDFIGIYRLYVNDKGYSCSTQEKYMY